jgi:hypothetical protein
MLANRARFTFVKTTRDVTVYREQEKGYAEDPVKVYVGSVFHVATQTETKSLHGERVEAVAVHHRRKWQLVLDAKNGVCGSD